MQGVSVRGETTTEPTRRRRWLRRFVLAGSLALAALAFGAAPAFAGTLSGVNWTVSNSQSNLTGVSYAFSFKTATAGTVKSVTMTMPFGTSGTPALIAVYGLGAGTISLAGNTLTYTVTSAISVSANIPLYVSVSGMTNTWNSGSYASTVKTLTSTSATIDSGTSQSVSFGASSTAASMPVAQTLTFTNNTTSYNLQVDPAGLSLSQAQAVVLTVQTNAASGYSLAAYDTGLSMTGPAFTVPAVTVGPGIGVATFPGKGFGVSAGLTSGGTDGATLAGGLTGGKWVGYPSAAVNFLTATGPTGLTADTLTLTNQVDVDYTVPAGTYNDTINYVVTPAY